MKIYSTDDMLYEYKTLIISLNDIKDVKEVRIGGSFGRKDNKKDSDFDVWYIFQTLPPLEKMVRISNTELILRLKLGYKYGLANLGRHRCIIFTKQEMDFYEKSFPVRVGVPRFLGETISLLGRSGIVTKISPIDDVIVSLTEFEDRRRLALQRGDQDLSRKYARRTLREMYYYRDSIRFVSNESVDEVIRLKFENNDEKVFTAARKFLEAISSTVNEESIYYRDLCHRLTFTMEKVRWELMDCLSDKEHYSNWVHGKVKYYAFYPSEIAQIVNEASIKLKTNGLKETQLLEDISTKGYSIRLITEFHCYHTLWMLKNARLALKRSAYVGDGIINNT